MGHVRQSEIAKRAGVSLATVSRVVNQSGYVAEDVRKRVEEAIAEMGYVPTTHSFAQHKRIVGIITPHGALSPYFEKLSLCLRDECERQGYYPVFAHSKKVDNVSLAAHAKQLSSIGVCGVIACTFNDEHLDEETRDALNKCNVPIVFIERTADCYGFNRILVDNTLGTYLATKHLLEQGHKHLIYVSRDLNSKVENSRTNGFMKAIDELSGGAVRYQICSCSSVSPAVAFNAVKEAYRTDPDITGIACWSDIYAIGALLYVYQCGLTVPGDVEIIGNDDIFAPELEPPLSSVRMPLEEIATSAVETIDKYQAPQSIPPIARTVSLEPQLILR